MINNREIEILNNLIKGEKYSFNDIALKYNISNRSARYYVDNLDEILKYLGYKKTERNKNIIKLDTNQDFKKLYDIFNKVQKLTSSDRVMILKIVLFFNNKGLNITEVSKKIKTSRTTVKKDLKILSSELEQKHINLLYRNKNGYMVDGDTQKIFLEKIELVNEILLLMKNKKNSILINSFLFEYIYKSINKEMLDTVEEFLLNIENVMKLNINEETYGNIFSYVLILLYFSKEDCEKEDIVSKKFLINTDEYFKVKSTLKKIFNDKYESNECVLVQITDLIMGLSINGFKNNTFEDWINGELIIKKMLSKSSKILQIDLTHDEILYSGLLYHIKPAIYRIKNGIQITNSVFKDLILTNDPILNVVKQVILEIENVFDFKFPEDEIALIGFHLKASIDRNTIDKTKKVILVCGLGYGSSRLLEQSLKEIYNLDILDILPYYLMGTLDLNYKNIDLILSTVDLDKKYDVPVIKINPILKEEDFNLLSKYGIQTNKSKISLKKLIKIISDYSNINDKELLVKELKLQFDSKIIDDISESGHILAEFLNTGNVKIVNNVKDWKDGVQIAGEILEKNNIVDKKYIHEMIALIEKHGSYIVVEEGLALPHAGISESVFMTGISLLIVKEGVLFPNNKRVNIFLSFATINRNDHIKILNNLFELITKYNFIEELISIDSYDELEKYFKKYKI